MEGTCCSEASVAGGIPVIKAIREGLIINDFSRIDGILNGTCNYILTRMAIEGLSYQEILGEAKSLGYAEADESLDVDGIDAAHKAVVLAYLAYGKWADLDEVRLDGITRVNQEDIRFAEDNGYAVKLIASVEREAPKQGFVCIRFASAGAQIQFVGKCRWRLQRDLDSWRCRRRNRLHRARSGTSCDLKRGDFRYCRCR